MHGIKYIRGLLRKKNPYTFRHRDAVIGRHSVQGNVHSTHLSSYYAASTEMIKILNIAILKYIKLITINYNVVILTVLKVLKISCSRRCCSVLYNCMDRAHKDLCRSV
jgi:hypothetical protein